MIGDKTSTGDCHETKISLIRMKCWPFFDPDYQLSCEFDNVMMVCNCDVIRRQLECPPCYVISGTEIRTDLLSDF